MPILDRLIASSIGLVPRSVVGRVARRYVAGEDLDAAMSTAQGLAALGCRSTFDVLGEFITAEREADATRAEYMALLDRIAAERLNANISVKLTAFGLLLNEQRAYERMKAVVDHAARHQNFVRIDMEDSACTTATLRLYRRLREQGRHNVGVVLQAYLRRTQDDIRVLADLKPSVRLCKGIYVEPPEIAFQDDEEVRASYRRCLVDLLDSGAYVGMATHDEALTRFGEEEVARRKLPKDRYEFQMLLGVTESLRGQLVSRGHVLRVYVPFGRDWYAYCVRRLKENPKVGRHVFLGLFRRR